MSTLVFFALIHIGFNANPAPVVVTHDFPNRAACLEAGRFLAESTPRSSTVSWKCQEAGK
jgi:hypothetical protein